MSLYRVAVLDSNGRMAESRTAFGLTETARLVISLADCIGEPWTKPLLDDDGELTISVKGAADRSLTPDERDGLTALLEEHGAHYLEPDNEGGRWGIGSPETGQ